MRYRDISDAQANAEALARRGTPYTGAHAASVTVAWDYRRREPRDLRHAIAIVRKAYSDEVPGKLHEGPDSIGEGGTPKMTARAEGYLFGAATADDAPRDVETGERDRVGYYFTPFRATLARFEAGDARRARQGAIVSHITIGQQDAFAAAISEGAHPLDAHLVAEVALRAFIRALTDIAIRPSVDTISVAEGTTAA